MISSKWTNEEIELLISLKETHTKMEIAARFEECYDNDVAGFDVYRSYDSIRKKLKRLGRSESSATIIPVSDGFKVRAYQEYADASEHSYKAEYEKAQLVIAKLKNQINKASPQNDEPLDILVIGDAHVEPDQDLSRFRLLAQFCADQRPDVVVAIGDWFGLTSLCSYNSRLEVEGVRVVEDLTAGNQAIEIFEETLADIAPGYNPRKIYTMGNHDHRLDRIVEEDPRLFGLIGTHLMDWEKHGWEVFPFLAPCRINGFRFQHYLSNKGSRKAIAGVYQGKRLLDVVNYQESIVVGHGHVLMTRECGLPSGKRVHAIQVGKFFTHKEDYAGDDDNNRWWTGLVMLRDCLDGDCDVETWNWKRLERNYLY